jgi:hypothetical protein
MNGERRTHGFGAGLQGDGSFMATYRFTTHGAIPAEVIENLVGMPVLATVTVTTLRVNVIDLSALNGLLTALHQQGLVLLDVRRDLWAGDDDALDAPWQAAPSSSQPAQTALARLP